MKRKQITADEVREYRERTGASMMDAKNFLQSQYDLEFVSWLMENASMEEKVNYLIEKEYNRISKLVDKFS